MQNPRLSASPFSIRPTERSLFRLTRSAFPPTLRPKILQMSCNFAPWRPSVYDSHGGFLLYGLCTQFPVSDDPGDLQTQLSLSLESSKQYRPYPLCFSLKASRGRFKADLTTLTQVGAARHSCQHSLVTAVAAGILLLPATSFCVFC